MIIWSGWGILIGVIAVACLVLTQSVVNTCMNDDHFYQTHGWPKLAALWAAAALSWPVGRLMNRGEVHRFEDPHTGQLVSVRTGGGGHSLFFIPAQYWWAIFLVLGVVFAAV